VAFQTKNPGHNQNRASENPGIGDKKYQTQCLSVPSAEEIYIKIMLFPCVLTFPHRGEAFLDQTNLICCIRQKQKYFSQKLILTIFLSIKI